MYSQVMQLLRIDREQALALLVEHYDAVPPNDVVPYLQVSQQAGSMGVV